MNTDSEDIFNGGFSIEQAIAKLRTRLLDLSSRNGLINYKHPNKGCLRFVNQPNLNAIFERLVENNKPVILKNVPLPPNDLFTTKRPIAESHAKENLGVDISPDFPISCCDPTSGKHFTKIQTLYYPADLEKLCRKIRAQARTVVEETGTNMLYLMFGFLEYYESEDSERPLIAPLLSLPVVLEKDTIDQESRTYNYSISYSGEDLQDNQSLRVKLEQEFLLQLPVFDEDDTPGTYLKKVDKTIRMQKRWKVRYQLTLGFLSFGKLAIWSDLDIKKWPGLSKSPLLRKLFSGGSIEFNGEYGEDYDIDKLPTTAAPTLIYNADSAQHSAIIDVLDGKNRVIIGPPGTGKSQTITNIIGAAINKGLKVLFVSEKLAALEVVRNRLNQADLGSFCLELHSHKTQKKKFLEDIQKCIDEKFPPTSLLEGRLSALGDYKKQLNSYAEFMSSVIGNQLGLTVNQLFWRTERLRQSVNIPITESAFLRESPNWTWNDIEQKRFKLDSLRQLYDSVGGYTSDHPWWGFVPNSLLPGDEVKVNMKMAEASKHVEALNETINQYIKETGLLSEPDLAHFIELREAIATVPDIPDNFNISLFCALYESNGNQKERTNELVEEAVRLAQKAILLKTETEEFIRSEAPVSYEELEALHKICFPNLKLAVLNDTISNLQSKTAAASTAYVTFMELTEKNDFNYYPITPSLLKHLENLLHNLDTASIKIENQPLSSINRGNQKLLTWVEHTSESFEIIKRTAHDYQLPFDGTAQCLASLNDGKALNGLLPHVTVEQQTVESLQFYLKEIPEDLGDTSLADLKVRHIRASELTHRIAKALNDIKVYTEDLAFPFNGSTKSLAQLTTVCTIAKEAPFSLLNYRGTYLSNPLLSELLAEAKRLKRKEADMRESLKQSIYLDALPDIDSLKAAFRTLRQTNDSILNIFNSDWKAAVKLVNSISKNKIKGPSINYQNVLTPILEWDDTVNKFHQHSFNESFGILYKGLETDTDKLEKLYDWYIQSREKLLKQGNLKSIIDLINIDFETLQEYATLSDDVLKASAEIHTCIKELSYLFFENYSMVSDSYIDMAIENFRTKNSIINYLIGLLNTYVSDDISSAKALHLLSAKLAFTKLKNNFLTLQEAIEQVRVEIEPDLPGISLHPIVDWGSYLDTIKKVQQDIHSLSDSLSPLNTTASPQTIHTFFQAKLSLEKAISELNIQIPAQKTEDWKSFANHIYLPSTYLSNFISFISPTINYPDITLKSAFDNLKKKQSADLLVLEVKEKFDEVQLGEVLFDGYKTDLEAISATLLWSNSLIKIQKIKKSELLPLLIGLDCKKNFYYYRQSLDKIDYHYQLTVSTLQELDNFGNFSWQEWNSHTSKTDRKVYGSLLHQKIISALTNADLVLPWSQYYSQKRDCQKEGLNWFISGLEEAHFPPLMTESVFQYSVYWSISKIIYSTHPILKEFNGFKHQALRTEFASLDEQIIKQTGKAFAHHIYKNRRVPQGDPGPSPKDKTDLWLLRHEINKTTRHLPIRQLLKRSGAALQALKPCFMMGPLSAAQYLEHGSLEFDLIVMDEASQLRPEEALGVIARGKQLVVVGDPKQLPPTRFFDRIMEDDEEEGEGANIFEGSESILDICQQLFHPVRTLKWHYRSQHESLIAFSNHHFYDGGLVFFPSPFNKSNRLGIKFRYLKNGVYENRRNIYEATRLVDSVFEHILKYPEESIGIVTLNQTQRDLVDDLLEKKLFNSEAVLKYKEYWEKEEMPLFVKNLENVQGDERDVIFISTTFGKGANANKVRQNFGPISRPDGWRRLNVLFTRARRKIELFTSMLPEDIVIDEQTPRGTKALRDYLHFANNNILFSGTPSGREADSDFELSVKDVLESKGYEVVPQLGVAGYFVDLAVKNPERLGEFLAAIECDGASYHSSRSARDRDRIRQEILESLGWRDRIYRIWSTDWFYNPRRETERLLEFLEQRRKSDKIQTDEDDYYIDIQDEEEFKSFLQEVHKTNIISETENTPPEIFVGLGDKVTFHYTDKPLDNLVVTLIQEASNPKKHLYNINTPLGKALLDAKVGDFREVIYNENKRVIRVRGIEKTA
ncbi:DUF4011 domain-containing protein [Runella slithyformis]|uniref:Transcription elongation factor GreA/GreB domain-containing protein n=1 Tax=Runella slithyformis (strain ATCC 29530 / DSM 19594 / LMG 11500 / NCIMB 11436 / LSU 4) TaxID=761193 RepID=A0A7U4E712_RUNSL|nr:DUF4011 domain-containing protein [Runella slithyformis]AEI49709.1 transcription elongation factor GreA/GreB domain-containing protein [Runella slithyformis DSM 19594]